MREIKFNVWDKKTKTMHLWESSEISLDSDGLIYYRGEFHPDYQDRFIFLQFIGLKDKGGRRIFEGDILRVAGVGNCKVIFINGAFGLTNDDKMFYFFNDDQENDIEYNVLGNIYKNPELLEEKK